eukprot:scaffold20950_cov151-Isochrysis_galbana.AAC.6
MGIRGKGSDRTAKDRVCSVFRRVAALVCIRNLFLGLAWRWSPLTRAPLLGLRAGRHGPDRHVGAEAPARPSVGQHGELKPRAKCSSDACEPVCDDSFSVHRHWPLAEPAKALHTTPPLWVGVSSLQTDGPHSVWVYRVAALQHKQPKGTEQPAGGGNTTPTPADCRQFRHRADRAHLTKQACRSRLHTSHHQRTPQAPKNSHH